MQAQEIAGIRRRLSAFCKFIATKDDPHYRNYVKQLTEELREDVEAILMEIEAVSAEIIQGLPK